MATEVINIAQSAVTTLKNTTCNAATNADGGIRANGTAMMTAYRGKEHDHIVMTKKSGTNGFYVRFENGIQICWDRLYIGTKSMSSSNTSNVYGGMIAGVTFPAAFIGKPSVVCDTESNGFSNSQASQVTSTSFAFRHWLNYSHGSITGIAMQYIAVGKWK